MQPRKQELWMLTIPFNRTAQVSGVDNKLLAWQMMVELTKKTREVAAVSHKQVKIQFTL